MKRFVLIPLLVFFIVPCRADHFPAALGNRWDFSFVSNQGGWGMNRRDSGTVSWEVTGVHILESFPEQQRIVIRQERALVRQIYTPGPLFEDEPGYDSIFDPPRITVDSVIIRGVDGENGLRFEGDSCFCFLHDPAAVEPADMVEVEAVKVFYDGDSLEAARIDPTPCRTGPDDWFAGEPVTFSTADEVGPVAHSQTSSPFIADYYFSELWTLTATSAGDDPAPAYHHLIGTGAPEGTAVLRDGGGGIRLQLTTGGPGMVKVQLYSPGGRRLQSVLHRIDRAGRWEILLPLAENYAAGLYLVRVEMPGYRSFVAPIPLSAGK